MAFAAKTTFNPMSVASNGCFSSPSLFAPAKISSSHPYLSIPYKPAKFQLYCKPVSSLSLTSFFSTKRKESTLVAAQGENNPALLDEVVGDAQDFEGTLNWNASVNDGGEDGGFVDSEPPEAAKVYVGNLPYDVDGNSLAELFEQAGVVEIAEVVTDRMSGGSRGFGFVTMSTEEEAKKAVELFNSYDMGGRSLTVNIAAPKGSRPERAPRENTFRIYVGNLPWTVNSSQLEEMFRDYGKVVSARVVSDRETGRSRGFGFVEMSSQSEMNDAIANLDGDTSFDGRALRVNAAEERPPRRGRF